MEPVALYLEDHAKRGPVEVNLEALHPSVAARLGKLSEPDQLAHPPLRLRASDPGFALVLENPRQPRRTAMTPARGGGGLELAPGHESLDQRFLDRALERPQIGVGGDVAEGSGRGGRGQAIDDPDIPAGEAVGAVDANAVGSCPVTAADHHVDRLIVDQSPEPRGRELAEDGVRSAREQRRGLVRERRGSGVPDGVDAAVDAAKGAEVDQVVDRAIGHSGRQ